MKQVVLLGGGAKARCFPFEMIGPNAKFSHVEVWGINFQEREWVPRYDRMFNIHRYDLLKKYGYPTYADAKWALGNPGVKIYLADRWPDERISRARIFPRDKIAEALPEARNDYHCNSLDWLIAFALYEKVEVLHLHGYNLERDGIIEQMSAPRCAEYWAGFAEAKGMKIILADDSSMFGVYHLVKTNRIYGYDDCPAYEDRTPDGKDPPYRYDDY